MATIKGTSRVDKLTGTGEDDTIYGFAANDTLDGADGNDTIFGGTGNDYLTGGAGNDTLWGDDGNDTLIGGPGIDTLYGGYGADILVGRDGDLMNGGGGGDTFYVGAKFGAPVTTAYGDDGNDTFQAISAFDPTQPTFDFGLNLNGGLGNDTFKFDGSVQAAVMDGGNGADIFDLNRMLSGTLTGGYGWDKFDIGFLLGTVSGGDGNDVISVGIAESGRGAHLYGNNGDDVISANVGSSIMEGGAGNDRLSDGLDLHDTASILDGGAGKDVLSSPGRDILRGGDGRDTLESGAFQNTLTGGAGADRFIYGDLVALETGLGIKADTITDFNVSLDILDLSRLLERAGAPADPFASGFLDLQAQNGSTLVRFDQDGGGDNFITLATLENAILTSGSGALVV